VTQQEIGAGRFEMDDIVLVTVENIQEK